MKLRALAESSFPGCLSGEEGEEPEKGPAAEVETFGDGTWSSGPTSNRASTETPNSPRLCLLLGADEELQWRVNSILANGLGTGGPIVVEILGADEGFTSPSCGDWSWDLSRVSPSKTRISNGVWVVDVDVAPGTYRSTDLGDCYWERMRDFQHGVNSILPQRPSHRG